MKIKKNSYKSFISLLLIFIIIPTTIYFGWKFSERQFYIVSLLIIIYATIPFFLMFENRKPQARELVVLAVMCVIAVTSRGAFIWIPHFKPMIAVIIIAGVALGAEAGFLTGAITGFVSNFIFGQGIWTPWQMFAYGMAGFLGGFLYKKGLLSKRRIPLAIFGGLIVVTIVGPILDTCSLFTMTPIITKESVVAIYLSGLPINIIHATATVLTLLLISKPMFEKLDRIRLKYGMMEES